EATDANGCIADFGTVSMLVYDLPVPAIGAQINVSCNGASDGSVTITGGDEYKLGTDPYQMSGTFSGLNAGPYTITVRDANQCTATILVTITEPTILSAMVAVTQPTCFGTDDGTITISSPMGGSGDFDYSIDGGTSWTAGLNNIGLAPGTYNVRIRDENEITCVVDLGNQMLAYPTILSATVTATQPTCFGTNDGIITISSPAGGSGSYDYSIDGGATWTASLSNIALAPGTYNVQIRDEDHPGCVIDLGNQVLAYPAVLSATAAATDVTCFGGNDGTITISNQSGGSGSYQYSISGGFSYQNTPSYTNLAPGSYNVRMRDLMHTGCFIIINGSLNISEPAILSADVSSTQPTCFNTNDGTITISSPAGGSGDFEYSIDGGTSWTAGLNNTGLAPGTYNVQIRDENHPACVIDLGNQVLAYPTILSAMVAATQPTCFGTNDGTITISSPMGGSNAFDYSIDGGTSWTAGLNNTGLAPGTYNVRIRDENHPGCVIDL
ncbi:MAG: SprB repeat-containing protein, partial [Saprospiraceae bacterium]|nr:SprB repeat-containing protein [Saprospiraceae bacterium]